MQLGKLVNLINATKVLAQNNPPASNVPLTQESYLSKLNEAQKQAVLITDGPLLVLAGAGTGKTNALTTRIAHILHTGLATPGQVLAVTFTNKASQEMRERVAKILGHYLEGLWLGTFHALGVRILRRHGELLGYKDNFTILDTDDQKRLIRQLIKAENIDEKQISVNMVSAMISRWKDRGLNPDMTPSTQGNIVNNLYSQYQERLKILNAMDFGDLLLQCLNLFKLFPGVLKQYQQQFSYILVDEYQDTNVAQYLWLRLLAQGHGNLCCVGDDDQSIYGWRGAEVGNILKFEKDFPTAKIIRLEQNYRSTSHILATASGLIANNTGRLGKSLWTKVEGGEKVLVRCTWDSNDEANFVAQEVEDGRCQGILLKEMAILVRAGFQTREFEERLLSLAIPYRVVGGMRFYERQEIRDALAYLRLIVQPSDSLAFERIVNLPKRGIGTTTIQQLHSIARDQAVPLAHAAYQYAFSDAKASGAKKGLQQFFTDLERWRSLYKDMLPSDLVKMVLDESGYTGMWIEDKSMDAPARLENLKELAQAIGEFSSLTAFLEHVGLVMENTQKNQNDVLSLMTLHAAKGLEFDWVFLPGWEESLFPHPRSVHENGQAGLEEERRLGYVGISRARKRSILTYCLQRYTHYQGWQMAIPSRFLKELPEENVIHMNASGKIHKQ